MRVLKWIMIAILILLTIGLAIVYILEGSANGSPKSTKSFFEKNNVSFQSHLLPYKKGHLRAIHTGNRTSKNLLCFLHGAPGAWNAYKSYMIDPQLLKDFQMVSVDRIGYGSSLYGEAELDIDTQVDALELVLDTFDYDSLLVIGHSYGGPIAGIYASRNPARLKATLMLAPVNDPYSEKIFWFNHIFKLKPVMAIMPDYINVSNQEKLHHAASLKKVEDKWASINTPIAHMHCSDDWIAPAKGNIAFSKKQLNPSVLELIIWEGAGHLIPFNSFDIVKSKILSYF